jgi:hypothetical protein
MRTRRGRAICHLATGLLQCPAAAAISGSPTECRTQDVARGKAVGIGLRAFVDSTASSLVASAQIKDSTHVM